MATRSTSTSLLSLPAQILGLGCWLALSYAVAWFGSQFRPGEWYAELDKAPWTPPGWAFGVAWSILYTLMAVAAWLVWRQGGFRRNAAALGVYLLQLLFNAAWSWMFFGMRLPGLALADLILLLAALGWTLVLFHRRSRAAAFLLVPYLVWVLYAGTLNGWIWWMN